MTSFNAARRDYDPDLDVRKKYHRDLAQRMKGDKPNGPFWLQLAGRRMGKTWTLEGVKHYLAGANGTYLDLRSEGGVLDGELPSTYLLLDEPGFQLQSTDQAVAFINRCFELQRQGKKILLALNPVEWSLLKQADQKTKRVDEKDELPPLAPLTDDQVKHLARRQNWAKTLLKQYGPENPWRRTPFLLEHLLEVAERAEALRKDLAKLHEEAITQASGPSRVYVEAVYHRGLSDAQRDTVRAVARGRAADQKACALLCRSGVLEKRGERYVLTDPILAHYLPPPLRIHHVSDIHVGPKTAAATDVKLKDAIGAALGEATGAGPVRGTYVHHVQGLAGSGTRPHLIVVSGDIAEWATAEQYREFAEWFKGLQRLLAPHPHLVDDDPRVLFVGGNHDVDWSRVLGTAGARDRHRPFAEAFKASRTRTWRSPRTSAGQRTPSRPTRAWASSFCSSARPSSAAR